jgi:hypothetical protein
MILAPDYVEAERQARLANAAELRENLRSPDLKEKVNKWSKRNGFEPEFVTYKFLTDDTFALNFIKDPVKQSFHQRIAAEHLRTRVPLISRFTMLPAGGTMALYAVNGLVVNGETISQTSASHGKSIDFEWVFDYRGKTLKVLATHKHTKENGGGQDLQYEDVRKFLVEAKLSKSLDTFYFAICDGPYYQRPYASQASRVAALNVDCVGPRARACTIGEIPGIYGGVVEEWMSHHRLTPNAELTADLEALRNHNVLGTEIPAVKQAAPSEAPDQQVLDL